MFLQNKTLLVFLVLDIAFLACAVSLIALPAANHASIADDRSLSNVAQRILLDECPLLAAIANGALMLLTFFVSMPAVLLRENRTLLVVHSWLLIVNAIFTLGVGLAIWFTTLQTRSHLDPIWNRQSMFIQSMLQFKFQCCGYSDTNAFVMDPTCPDLATAAVKGLCVGPFSAFANSFLDVVFTSMFAFCALDGLLLLSGLCVLKDRAEKARYKLIDMKGEYSKF